MSFVSESLKVISNNGSGAIILNIDTVSKKEVIKMILNDKEDVLKLKTLLDEFVNNQ